MTNYSEPVSEGTENTNPANVDSLSYLKQQKAAYLLPWVGDEIQTYNLISLLDSRGKNSFDSVISKIETLNDDSLEDQDYYIALGEKFELEKTYTSLEIISKVAQVRRAAKLKPYKGLWKQKCEADFFNLFIVHDVYNEVEIIDGKIKKQLVGYKPMYRLKF